MYLQKIADLLTVQIPVAVGEYTVAGYFSEGDGGGGTFVWVQVTAPNLPSADGGIIIHRPTVTTGYFKRIYSGAVNVRWFGAIMGADTGNGVINDVTDYVHRARDSSFAKNGTIYFPADWELEIVNGQQVPVPKPYVGAFEFLSGHGEINIVGDGKGTVLKYNGSTEPDNNSNYVPKPVLRLGWCKPDWRYRKVYNLQIDGQSVSGTSSTYGVLFDNTSANSNYNDNVSGRWILEKVLINYCIIGVFKKSGNIGNRYIDCTFENNNIGVRAISDAGMHTGCDRYDTCHFYKHDTACVLYVDSSENQGQLIFDGCVFEYNKGFAVFIDYTSRGSMMYNALCLRNVWFEENGGSRHGNNHEWENSTITIDNNQYLGSDMYFKGVRSVRIDDCIIQRIQLIDSSVNLYNCRMDYPSWGWQDGYQIIGVDNRSSLVGYEMRYYSGTSDQIFVNSISYDGSRDIYNAPYEPTSVWGPLRSVKQREYHSGRVKLSLHFDEYNRWFVPLSGQSGIYAYPNPVGVLSWGSGRLTMESGVKYYSYNAYFELDNEEPLYYVWSIHTYLDAPEGSGVDVKGRIANYDMNSGSSNVQFGYTYFKPSQWVCSYGIKYVKVDPNNIEKMLLIFETTNNVRIFIADYQVITFKNLADAQSFVNSRAFLVDSGTDKHIRFE